MGYPIGTFLFWKAKREVINDSELNIYEFISDFHQRDRANNPKKCLPIFGHDYYFLVLDGQQRLSSLFLSLSGSLALNCLVAGGLLMVHFPRRNYILILKLR